MGLSVEIVGFDELIADATKAGANAEGLVKAAITNSVNRIQSEARSRAPHRTGTLQRSILTQVDYPEGKVAVGEKYGIYFEQGTGIYGATGNKITPKKAKVLAFKVGGKLVFARSVEGIQARPFFKPGIEASAQYISDQFVKVIELLTQGLAGKGFNER